MLTHFQKLIIFFWFFLSILLRFGDGANILAVFHTPSKSHLLLAQPLLFELVQAGHTVTVISPFPEKKSPKGYNDVSVPEVIDFTKGKLGFYTCILFIQRYL